jgi:hypothetical protein
VHLEEKHGLIAGGIALRTFCFQTNERSVGTELGMVTGLLVRDGKAQCIEVKLPGTLQVFKIELYSHKPRRNIAHKSPGPFPIVLPLGSPVSRFGMRGR